MKFLTSTIICLATLANAEQQSARYLRKFPKPDNGPQGPKPDKGPQGPKPDKGPNGVAVGFNECRPIGSEALCNAKDASAPTIKEYEEGQWCGCFWSNDECDAIEC